MMDTSHYSIVVARKPLSEKSIVENVLKWGTGGINIDGSRIETNDDIGRKGNPNDLGVGILAQYDGRKTPPTKKVFDMESNPLGRFPANIIFDEEAGKILDQQSGISKGKRAIRKNKIPQTIYGNGKGIPRTEHMGGFDDEGGASRFFYCPKNEDDDYEIKTNNMNIDLRLGDCIEVLKTLPDNSVDSIVTDPPYGLGFMNKEWDSPEKLRELTQREEERSAQRKAEGKSPTTASFSKSVPPGLAIKGAREGRWFQEWCELWATELLRVLKPGGHLISFSAPRTYHRMATAFEDAGFEIRDQIMWVFGSGFPKSHNIGKAIDKIEGNEREVLEPTGRYKYSFDNSLKGDIYGEYAHDIKLTKGNSKWEGWGTALKPAHEPIVLARKPLSEKSIAENVLKHGTGGINIDGSRIEAEPELAKNWNRTQSTNQGEGWGFKDTDLNEYTPDGRFPANIIFDEEAGQLLDEQSGISKTGDIKPHPNNLKGNNIYGNGKGINVKEINVYFKGDIGGASRFFYCPKTSKKDRNEGLDGFEKKTNELIGQLPDGFISSQGKIRNKPLPKSNHHPTVKPTDLMRYLINLVTPKGGTTLDPFMGSGSTGKAAIRCGVNFIGIEKEQEYMDIARARIEHEKNKPVQQELF